MTNFVENLINIELPTNGFKPFIEPKDLLQSRKSLYAPNGLLQPTVRGYFQNNWKHGGSVHQGDRSFFLEVTDRFKFGKFILRPRFVFQDGNKALYQAGAGLDLGSLGELELTHQPQTLNTESATEIAHYYSMNPNNDVKNGLNLRSSVSFTGLKFNPVVRLSSIYTQTLDVLDRKTKKLNTKTSIYGVDTSVTVLPLKQTHYSIYYQSKAANLDFIAAYMRKSVDERYFSNNIVTGFKYRTADKKKILAKASYNVEDRQPQVDLMVRKTHQQDKKLKTFHKISSDLKVGSGFSIALKALRVYGLAEVNFMNNDANCQPFGITFRVETNDKKNAKKK